MKEPLRGNSVCAIHKTDFIAKLLLIYIIIINAVGENPGRTKALDSTQALINSFNANIMDIFP